MNEPNTPTQDRYGKIRRRSAGVIPVRRDGDNFRFLLLRSYSHWDFPKGAVEDGESDIAAAIRETAEESGLDDLVFSWGEEWMETSVYAKDKIARYYIAETQKRDFTLLPNPETGEIEHEEGRWVDYRTMVQMTPPRLRLITDWVGDTLGIRDEL